MAAVAKVLERAAPAEAEPAAPHAGRRGAARTIAAVLLLVALGGAAFVVVSRRGDGPAVAYPAEWDPRVAEYAEFVENERFLDFDHPVAVEFLPDDEFVERALSGTDRGEDDEEALEGVLASLRALGLVAGDVDLGAALDGHVGESLLGFYDIERETLVVRGTDLRDPRVRTTLVHELTHALQDQHFDLSAVQERVGDGIGAFSVEALIEGDATVVEDAYRSTLSAPEQAQLDTGALDGASSAEVPEIMRTMLSLPYVFGDSTVRVLGSISDRLDEAYDSAPASDEWAFDPIAWVRSEPAVEVDEPNVPADATVLDSGEFGAPAWFVLLAERIDPTAALRAADGWGGDRYVTYDDGPVCARLRFVGDTPVDEDEMAAAVDAWVAAGPAGAARAGRDDNGAVWLEACDPGPSAAVITGRHVDALILPIARARFLADMVQSGVAPEEAWCRADALVVAAGVEPLRFADAPLPPDFDGRRADLETACLARAGRES